MSKENKELYEFDKFCLDVSERFLLKNGKRVALADRAFDTLCVLVRRGNRLVSKDELMTEVWADAIVEENNLDKNISALRRILGERGGKQTFIETVRGHGYRFVAEVQQIQTDMETRQHGDTAMSETSAPMGGSTAAKSQISNLEFQTGNRDGDERPAGNKHPIEEQRPKSIDRIENPKSKIQNPKSNVVALAAWRHETAADEEANTTEPATNNIREDLQTNAVAVLPYKLIAVADSDEYLGIGMADALIVSLSKIGDLQVRPTASVMPFAMSGANPIGAGRELKVEAILDGNIHQSGDNLRVSLQLIRVADGSLLWAEKFDGTTDGIFQLEDEISASIAQKLRRNLDENTLWLLTTRGTKLLAAYQAFLKARFHFHQGLPEHYQKSNAFYAEAIRLDPNYAQAYAGLADVYILEVIFGFRRPQDAFAQVKEAVTKAVELDSTSAEVYAAHAHFNICFNRDLAEAGRSARKAVELNPYSANAHNLLGQSLMFRGFYAEAETALKQALEIDPLGFWHSCILTICYFLWRKYEQAIAQSLTTTAINPKLYAEVIKHCWSLTELGRHAEAFALYEEVSTQPGGESGIWFIGNAYAVAGQSEKARAVLAQLKEISAEMYLSPFFFALVHAGLNETQEAIDYIEQLVENRDPWMVFIYADPRLDNLRSDSRFQRLVNMVVPEAVRMKDNNPSSANSTTSSEPNQNDADSKSGEREIRTIPATALKFRRTVRFAATCIALVILASGIGYALYKFANRPPIEFRADKLTQFTTNGKTKIAAVSPDGKYLANVQENGEQQSLWVRQVSADNNIQILPPSEIVFRGLSFSPDGNRIFYVVESALFQIPALGGSPKKVLENINGNGIGFSPDGKQFAFVRYSKEASAIFIADADGTNERQLYSLPRPAILMNFPVWSPDGKVIACSVRHARAEHYVLAVQAADGAALPINSQPITTILQLAWLPDSKGLLMIGVSENKTSVVARIYQMSYPGGVLRRITNDFSPYTNFSLSADGRSLFAVRHETITHVWTMPSNDANQIKQLTAGQDKYDGLLGLGWMPDGRIFYESKPGGRAETLVMNADGGNVKQVLENGYMSTLSPDGRFFVYQIHAPDEENGLFRHDLSDNTKKRLTTGFDAYATVTPDGKQVLFTRYDEPMGAYRVSIDGGEPTKIFSGAAYMPTASPDGKQIAFYLSKGKQKSAITIMPFDGGEPTRNFEVGHPLPMGTLPTPTLQWTPDGRAINYVETRDGVSNIWRQPVDGGSPVQITNFTTNRIANFAFSPDGSRLALSRGTFNSDVVLIENAK